MRLNSAAARCSIAVLARACSVLAVVGLCTVSASADTLTDVGYYQLQAELGAAIPTGAGVTVSQVEAPDGSGHYGPDTTSALFPERPSRRRTALPPPRLTPITPRPWRTISMEVPLVELR